MGQFPSVVVSGMHRSGASWVADLVQALGVDIGTDFVFEDRPFVDLNRRLLRAAASEGIAGHPDWGWTEDERWDVNVFPDFLPTARRLAEARKSRAHRRSFGWKDPQASLLLDFWDGVLPHSRYILVYRLPWEVADSMQRRGAAVFLRRPDYAYRIWLFYNRRLLDFYRRHASRCVLVNPDALPLQLRQFKQLLQEKLGLELQHASFAPASANVTFTSQSGADPLVALLNVTSPECVELLSQLDGAADIPGADLWSVPPANRVCLRPDTPLERGRSVPLSVVIPCYNDGEFLLEAIASVERSVPESTELIIVNDGSDNERTLGVLRGLKKTGYYILDQANAGVCVARNAAIRVARGRYILPLDADNRIRPGFVPAAISILDARPEVGVVHGDWQEFGGRSGVHHVAEFDLDDLLWNNYVDTCAVLRKQLWSDCGGYDPHLPPWGDWELWINAMKRGWRFAYLPQVTFDYLVRPDSLVSGARRAGVREGLLERLIHKHWDIYASALLKRMLRADVRLAHLSSSPLFWLRLSTRLFRRNLFER
jgi:glycosyltransferase involved in cell wall biosynthesis